MARLPYVRTQDIPATHPELAARKENAVAVLAHSLDGATALLAIGLYIRKKSRLNGRLTELAVMQVGLAVRSSYEFYHHIRTGFGVGVTEADVDALLAESRGERSGLGELEREVLRMARQMTCDLRVDIATFSFLEKTLGREQLVDLALIIGHYNNVVRLLGCFDVELEPNEGFEELAQRFPLPA